MGAGAGDKDGQESSIVVELGRISCEGQIRIGIYEVLTVDVREDT